jgi:hypothetical protein
MDFVQLISQFGFPAAGCIAMAWYVKYITDQNSQRMDKLNEDHKAEMDNVTKALTNNTLALQHLSDLIAWNNGAQEDDRK